MYWGVALDWEVELELELEEEVEEGVFGEEWSSSVCSASWRRACRR